MADSKELLIFFDHTDLTSIYMRVFGGFWETDINGADVEMLTHSATDCVTVGSGMRKHFVFLYAVRFKLD